MDNIEDEFREEKEWGAAMRQIEHTRNIVAAPKKETFLETKYWFVDTCLTLDAGYETLVAPCNEKGHVYEDGWLKPTLLLNYRSEAEAKDMHKQIVKILETTNPERVPARLQSFVGEWFVRKSVLDDLHSKQQEIARQGKDSPAVAKGRKDKVR